MPAPKAISRAAMIPSKTTFHMAVGAGTHVMQRRMVAVLATQAALPRGGVNGRGALEAIETDFASPVVNFMGSRACARLGRPRSRKPLPRSQHADLDGLG